MAKGKVQTVAQPKVVVVLGGVEYELKPLPMGPAREWRKKHSKPLQAVIGVLRSAGKLEIQDDAGAWNVGAIGALLQQVGTLLLGSVDMLVDAMFEYAPVLEADRERIEATATDVEAMAALWEVIQLAYPFGSIMSRIGGAGDRLSGTSGS